MGGVGEGVVLRADCRLLAARGRVGLGWGRGGGEEVGRGGLWVTSQTARGVTGCA